MRPLSLPPKRRPRPVGTPAAGLIRTATLRSVNHQPTGQGALILRLSGVDVPIGSLLSVIAVTVTANAPTALAGAAVRVRTERPPMVAVGAENDAVTLLGRPLTLRATGVPYRPVVARNEMLIPVR